MRENNWYVYRHLKPCGEVFYIGIGQKENFKRAYSKHNRNKWWKNTVNKYPNYEVQVLKSNMSLSEAKDIEILLISWYRRIDCCRGTLVNLTDGGEGTHGFIYSEESKNKMSLSAKGKVLSKKTKDRIGTFNKGKEISIDTRIKIGKAHRGKNISDEVRQKIAKGRKGILNPHKKKSIIQQTKEGEVIQKWNSISEACAFLGLSNSAISNNLKGLSNYCGGFKFKYINYE